MSYNSARNQELMDAHQRYIDDFAQQYRDDKETVVLLPGGMGSQLDMSVRPYVNDSSVPFKEYDPVWMDLEVIFGRDADLIAIAQNGHDKDDHIVIPNGPLRFLVNAYDGTEEYFRTNEYNYIVFGYDWRRSLAEAAVQLQQFLINLRDRVLFLRGNDPLPRTTLVAHSQGGLVAKIFLQQIAGADGSTINRWMKQLVTVATPFYGTSTHQQRYYVGQSPLNAFYGTRQIATIAGGLPGPYVLMFADKRTLDRDGPALGLTSYPVSDDTTGQPADPYAQAMLTRYPSWVNPAYLEEALSIRETITAPLPKKIADRIFHIRSGLDAKTATKLHWANLNGTSFTPEIDPCPLRAVPGPGDGTVPFWSARLAQTASKQIYDLTKAKDHGALMEHDEVLKVLRHIIENSSLPKSLKSSNTTMGRKKASDAKVERFLTAVLDGKIRKNDASAHDPEIWRRLIEDVRLC